MGFAALCPSYKVAVSLAIRPSPHPCHPRASRDSWCRKTRHPGSFFVWSWRRPDPWAGTTSRSGGRIAGRATLKLPCLSMIMRADDDQNAVSERRHGMSDTQSQTPQQRVLHRCVAASCSGNFAADSLKKIRAADASRIRMARIHEQNHEVRVGQSGRPNRGAKDFLLIPCRFSEGTIDDPTVGWDLRGSAATRNAGDPN
jgi:hypothetical protein